MQHLHTYSTKALTYGNDNGSEHKNNGLSYMDKDYWNLGMIHNPNYKVVEFDHFIMQAGLPNFVMSVSEWIEKTNALV